MLNTNTRNSSEWVYPLAVTNTLIYRIFEYDPQYQYAFVVRACSRCKTPEHLFYKGKCPECQRSEIESSNITFPRLWYTFMQIRKPGADPRQFERVLLGTRNTPLLVDDDDCVAILARIAKHESMSYM